MFRLSSMWGQELQPYRYGKGLLWEVPCLHPRMMNVGMV